VFVGNLSFKVTEDWLREELTSAGGTITDLQYMNHEDTGKWKGTLFCSYGSSAEATAAVAALNGKDLDGRAMKVELATPRKNANKATGEENEPSSSVFLGNLPYDLADDKGIYDFFKDCGSLTNLKWLMKDGEFRGMCFLDFDSIESATKAVALNEQMLLGRTARINFAKPRAPPSGDKWGGGGGGKGAGAAGKTQRPCKPTGDKPDGCTELFCGNLPWGVDEEKITAFFATAGATVTGTRWLNDKETGEFKGVGFVTFADTADVDKAVSLGGEALEGRSIRVDYAGQKKAGAWQGGGGGGW